MSRTIRFHLDEHCDPAIAAGLRLLNIDVTTTADAGLWHASDDQQIAFALNQRRVVFTQDKDFLRMHASGVPHAGFVYCHQQSRSIGDIVQGLTLIWEILEPEEIQGRVEFL